MRSSSWQGTWEGVLVAEMGGAERPDGGLVSGGQQADAALLAAEMTLGCARQPPVPTLLPQGVGQGLFCSSLFAV